MPKIADVVNRCPNRTMGPIPSLGLILTFYSHSTIWISNPEGKSLLQGYPMHCRKSIFAVHDSPLNTHPQPQTVGFCDLVGVGITPV